MGSDLALMERAHDRKSRSDSQGLEPRGDASGICLSDSPPGGHRAGGLHPRLRCWRVRGTCTFSWTYPRLCQQRLCQQSEALSEAPGIFQGMEAALMSNLGQLRSVFRERKRCGVITRMQRFNFSIRATSRWKRTSRRLRCNQRVSRRRSRF